MKKCDHTSVGMLVYKGNKLLLIQRGTFPFGFAPPAGHVDESVSYEDAAVKELREEIGLDILEKDLQLVIEGRKDMPCRRADGNYHIWKVYKVEINDQFLPIITEQDKILRASFYSPEEMKQLSLKTEAYLRKELIDEQWQENPGIEIVWYEWFKQLHII